MVQDRPRLCLMMVHAHPDDESIGTGGTFLRYAEQGVRTVLVCATAGEEGEIHDPDLDPVEARPRLGEIRRRELACAARILGIHAVELLGYRDSGMAGTPANQRPDSFHQADPTEAAARLVRLIRRYRPQVLVSYNARGFYGHPDHIKAYEVTRLAFERAGDPAFAPAAHLAPWQPLKRYETAVAHSTMMRWREIERQLDPGAAARQQEMGFDPDRLATPDEQITTRIDIRPYLTRRQEAIRCHRTQIPPDSPFLRPIPDEAVAAALGTEEYVLARSLVRTPPVEDDLFAGLR